jgi:hypothetical protein
LPIAAADDPQRRREAAAATRASRRSAPEAGRRSRRPANADSAETVARFRSSYLGRIRALADQFDIRIEKGLLARPADDAGPLADGEHFYKLD